MAQNLLADLVSSDEENVVPNKVASDTTDSDSDAPPPGVKRQRSTVSLCNTTEHGTLENTLGMGLGKPTQNFPLAMQSSLPAKPKGLFSSSNIYAVRNTLDVAKSAVTTDDTDEEDEIENIFKKKKPQPRGKPKAAGRKRKSSTSDDASSQRKRHVSVNSDTEEPGADSLKEYETKYVVLSEDEDTEVESGGDEREEFLSLSQTREPTPPPSPSVEVVDVDTPPPQTTRRATRVTRRQKRQQKKAKETAEAFTRVQTILEDLPNEADVSIVEVTPTKSETEREISVKIRSRSGIQRFSMKKKDSFADIVEAMARHEFVKAVQVALYLNDQKIHMYDTPQTLELQVADIVECYIRKLDEVTVSDDEDDFSDPDILKIQVQGKDAKSKLILPIRKDEPMEKLMREYCSKKQLAYDKMSFQFDGEDISPHDTPDDLELETNYCIDVI